MTEIEKKKEYLRSYQKAVRRMERSEEKMEEIRLGQIIPATDNDGMPHAHNATDLSGYAALLDEEEHKYLKIRYKCAKLCHTSNGLYACIDAKVYYSKDYETTWTKYNTPDILFTGITAYCPDRNLTLLCAYNATQLCISVDNGATWQTFESEGINKVLLTKKYVKVYSNAGYHDRYFEYVSGDLTAVVSNMYGKELELAPEQETIVIGSVTAAGQGTIPGTAKKITLFVKKVTATATTGTAVYQYVVMPTTEESITAPKISATTGAISNTCGTIAVSGETYC